jgi:phosphotriesterase-related protein
MSRHPDRDVPARHQCRRAGHESKGRYHQMRDRPRGHDAEHRPHPYRVRARTPGNRRPIVTHTYAASRCGLDQQRLFKAEGVDLRRVVIGHSGDSDDFDYLRRLLDAGSFIGADRFGLEMNGLPNVEQRCRIVAHLVAEGYEDRILLSHDSSVFTDWWPEEYGQDQTWRQEWNLELIPRTVVPTLLALGVSARAVDKMLVDNPRSLLESNQPY